MMVNSKISRRGYLTWMGAGAAAAAAVISPTETEAQQTRQSAPAAEAPPPDHERRIRWWREAKFGMLIHCGLYSVLGRYEWAMDWEGIPVSEYEQLAKQFKPKPNSAQTWARLARRAGMKYMVFTSKHHEGFCNFTTKLTDYCAPKQGPGRDLVKEFLDAARAEGLRVGFAYSLIDWHHPDGARCANNEQARRRFIDYTHGQIRELCTNYGKLDVLWYNEDWPLDAQGWESQKMNEMVLRLQPDIVINNRNALFGDFATPALPIRPVEAGRDWEACVPMNSSWGYQAADDDWKSPKTILRALAGCARGGGNCLLNIGPRGDGSIPEESVRILNTVGAWMDRNGAAIYDTERCRVTNSAFANFSRKGNTLFIHVHFWPGQTVSIGGLQTKVQSAKLLASGKEVAFKQDDFRVQFTNLPAAAPDDPVTVIAAECASEPVQDLVNTRMNRPRGSKA
jgi:alpha-L-fucosidase